MKIKEKLETAQPVLTSLNHWLDCLYCSETDATDEVVF